MLKWKFQLCGRATQKHQGPPSEGRQLRSLTLGPAQSDPMAGDAQRIGEVGYNGHGLPQKPKLRKRVIHRPQECPPTRRHDMFAGCVAFRRHRRRQQGMTAALKHIREPWSVLGGHEVNVVPIFVVLGTPAYCCRRCRPSKRKSHQFLAARASNPTGRCAKSDYFPKRTCATSVLNWLLSAARLTRPLASPRQ